GHWLLRLLPFGIGQFSNGDPVFGSVYLSSELVLLAAHVTGAVVQERLRDPKFGDFRDHRTAVAWWWVRTLSGASLFAVSIFGIIDAWLWSPARGRARFEQRVAVSLVPVDS